MTTISTTCEAGQRLKKDVVVVVDVHIFSIPAAPHSGAVELLRAHDNSFIDLWTSSYIH